MVFLIWYKAYSVFKKIAPIRGCIIIATDIQRQVTKKALTGHLALPTSHI